MGKDIDEKIDSKKFNYIGTRDAIYDALSQIFYERFKIDDSLSKKNNERAFVVLFKRVF